MATITPTITDLKGASKEVLWTQINQDDEGGSTSLLPNGDLLAYPDKTISADGTFDTGAYALEGSNDGTNWHQCYSLGGSIAGGTAISFSAAGSAVVAENFRFYRIANDNNGTTEDVDISMSCAR